MQNTYSKDGFLFFKEQKRVDSILGDRLILDSNNLNRSIDYINKESIKSISVTPTYFKINDLDFLKYITSIEGLYILSDDLNTSNINLLSRLKVLRMGKTKAFIDFKNFPDLEVLSIVHSKFVKNIDFCDNLFWLWLDSYKDDSLDNLKNLKKLTHLHLNGTSIKTLKGIEDMTSLTELYIDTAKQLETLDGISGNNKSLKNIDVYNARNLVDYDALRYLENLERLRFTKTGDMQDIYVLKSLKNLKRVILGIKVLNGDMILQNEIEEYKFINYPHYNLKSK